MISKQYLKDFNCKGIYEFFIIIVESEINGHNKQTKEYIKKLSNNQCLEFFREIEFGYRKYLMKFLKFRMEE